MEPVIHGKEKVPHTMKMEVDLVWRSGRGIPSLTLVLVSLPSIMMHGIVVQYLTRKVVFGLEVLRGLLLLGPRSLLVASQWNHFLIILRRFQLLLLPTHSLFLQLEQDQEDTILKMERCTDLICQRRIFAPVCQLDLDFTLVPWPLRAIMVHQWGTAIQTNEMSHFWECQLVLPSITGTLAKVLLSPAILMVDPVDMVPQTKQGYRRN
jgi:hypothetical protein